MFGKDFDAIEASMYDEFDASSSSAFDDFGMDDFGMMNSAAPAGDDFHMQERRRKRIVGIAASIAAVVATFLIFYAFAAGLG